MSREGEDTVGETLQGWPPTESFEVHFSVVLILYLAWGTEHWQQGARAANKCETPAFPYPLRVLEPLNEECLKLKLIYLLITVVTKC